MNFSSGYHPMNDLYGPMDRGFYQGGEPPSESGQAPPSPGSITGPESLGYTVKDIGMSVPMGIAAPNVQGIYGKIRSGVSKMEIGFPGAIAGNRQAHTPEMYGKDQRLAMRELAMANEVEYTTHAAYQIMGMTGAIEQGSDLIKFDMNRARMAQHEVERAIDFAADVAKGGSVVVHTGEFDRPLTDIKLPEYDINFSQASDGRIMFKQRLTEDKDAKFFLIDDRTGQAMSQVEKDRLVAFPKWNKYDPDNTEYWKNGKGKAYRDNNGDVVKPGDYIDYLGNRIKNPFDPYKGRVPRYNKDTGRFEVNYLSFDDFEAIAEEKNKWFEKLHGRPPNPYEKVSQTEAFFQATLETNEGHSRGWALQYGERVDREIESLQKLKEAKEFYERLDARMPEEKKWMLLKRDPYFHGGPLAELVAPKEKTALEVLNEAIRQTEKGIEFARQASTSQEQQAKDTFETKQHIKDPVKYLERFAIRGYAEAAIHAMERTEDPNRPVMLALENIFPERFGGHPQELKWIIEKSREKMVEMLTKKEIELGLTDPAHPAMERDPETGELRLRKQPNPWYREGLSIVQAEQLAEQHIKATIDTGHLNMWRKFFQPSQGATPDQNEAEFRRWYLDQIEDLAKNRMIGNLHLTDNFGFQDDHLAAGQGNAPLKETIQILKKYGYDKAITTEPGADASTDVSDFHGLMKTWRYFGSSIYGIGAPAGFQRSWGQVQYSYFGQDRPPYFVFGAYAPSNDWTLWTQVPME
jgi:hypothetical protein